MYKFPGKDVRIYYLQVHEFLIKSRPVEHNISEIFKLTFLMKIIKMKLTYRLIIYLFVG